MVPRDSVIGGADDNFDVEGERVVVYEL
jgi:hypothetical protein